MMPRHNEPDERPGTNRRGVDDAPQLTGAEETIVGTDAPDDDVQPEHTVEYVWDDLDETRGSSSYGWLCSCGTDSGGRRFVTFDEAQLEARGHLSARLKP